MATNATVAAPVSACARADSCPPRRAVACSGPCSSACARAHRHAPVDLAVDAPRRWTFTYSATTLKATTTSLTRANGAAIGDAEVLIVAANTFQIASMKALFPGGLPDGPISGSAGPIDYSVLEMCGLACRAVSLVPVVESDCNCHCA